MDEEWLAYLLGMLSGLSVAAVIELARFLVKRWTSRKVNAAVAEDETLNELRDAVAALGEALVTTPTPASREGDPATNKAINEWKNSLNIAITHLQFTVPDAPYRPIPDPALVDRIDKMEQMAAEAVAEVARQTGIYGERGDIAVYSSMKWGYELQSEARFVLECYEVALREHLQRDQRRSSG